MDNQNVKIVNLGNSYGKMVLYYVCLEGYDCVVEIFLRFGVLVEK